jgi:hypothetical protein
MNTTWNWLDDLTPEDVQRQPIPFNQLLEDSVYYPASGYYDGRPVEILGKLSRSFVYVDYNIPLKDLKVEMERHGFKGYQIIASREITEREIAPRGWRPHVQLLPGDGNPQKPFDNHWVHRHPYAYWTIWQRQDGYDDAHGPNRFSMLSLCADGVAAFDALYYTWKTKPLVMCFIGCDGFSLNWTYFRVPGLIMHRLAMNNPAGKPEYIMMYGCPDDCDWPEYPILVSKFEHANLYKRSEG